jgi:DNA-binding transcriptional ArsR family regulator
MSDLLKHALDYHAHGIACLPFAPSSKKPGPGFYWGSYQRTSQSRKEVEILFRGNDEPNIAILGGEPSDGLIIVDADNPQTFDEFSRRLAGLGIETWIMQRDHFVDGDPHSGGGQYYLKAPVAVESRNVDGLEIRGQGQIAIAPPSIHPTGARYQFIHRPPTIFRLPSLDAIPELSLEPAPKADNDRRIPRLAWRLLNGDPEMIARYDTRSEAEAALCASLIRAGYGFDEIVALFVRYPGPGKFAEMYAAKPKNAIRYLHLTFQNALAFIEENAGEVEALARKLTNWAISRQWQGRTSATDRAVYIAHLQIVQRCGKDLHCASARELAELAGVGWRTAARANHRLVEAGLIELVIPATPSLSNIWKLVPPDLSLCDPLHHSGGDSVGHKETNSETHTSMRLDHDAFRWSGLGKTGAEIYYALQGRSEASVKELQEATGRGRSTIYKKLNLMTDLYMAELLGRGRWRALDVNLDAVAEALGTAGKGKEQRARHRQERRLHRRMLELGKGGD